MHLHTYIVCKVLENEHEGHDEHQLVVHHPLEWHPVYQEGNGGAAAAWKDGGVRGRGRREGEEGGGGGGRGRKVEGG